MSAKGRRRRATGTARMPINHEVYETTDIALDQGKAVLRQLLAEAAARTGRRQLHALEPAAASGRLVRELMELHPTAAVDAVEIRPECEADLRSAGAMRIVIADFRAWRAAQAYDLIFANAPFTLTVPFIDKGLDLLVDGGSLMILQRLGFLASITRRPHWDRWPLRGLVVLSRRPKFVYRGSDSTDYAWFIFTKGWSGSPSVRWSGQTLPAGSTP